MKYEIEYIEKIAKIVTENNLSEIHLEDGDQTISIKKEGVYCQAQQPIIMQTGNMNQTSSEGAVADTKTTEQIKGKAITSPMVGAFYAAPAPGAKRIIFLFMLILPKQKKTLGQIKKMKKLSWVMITKIM